MPDERLSQLTWLVLHRKTATTFQRSKTILNFDLGSIGRVEPLPREFDADVERALFVLALYSWEDYFADQSTPWQPFLMPWTYTVSRHPFGFPPRAPDVDRLNWTLAGNPDEEVFEVPLVMHYFENKHRPRLQRFCAKWSRLVERVAPVAGSAIEGFNPRIEHFEPSWKLKSINCYGT